MPSSTPSGPGDVVVIYPWIWRRLPGPRAVRALLALVLVAGVLAGCALWLFPAVAALLDGGGGVVALAGQDL